MQPFRQLDYYNLDEQYSQDELMVRDTVRGWVSNKKGKPITAKTTRTAAPNKRCRARCRSTSALSDAAFSAAAAWAAEAWPGMRNLKNAMNG